MQAIITKYLPAAGRKGSRIKATASRGSIIVPYPHDAGGGNEGVHTFAAKMLCQKFAMEDKADNDRKRGDGTLPPDWVNPWLRPMVCAGMPGNGPTQYCHVTLPDSVTALEKAANEVLPWLYKAKADGLHLSCAMPNHLPQKTAQLVDVLNERGALKTF